MADLTHAPSSPISLLGWIATPLRVIGDAFATMPDLARRTRAVEQLLAQSDDQLSAQGLSRDEVVHHVFDDFLNS